MNISADCMNCVIKNEFKKLKNSDDEAQKVLFMKRAMQKVADCPDGLCSPDLVVELDDIFYDMFGRKKVFTEEKKLFNDMLLAKEDMLRQIVKGAASELKAGLLMSRTGNYIDFGVLSDVSGEKLNSLLGNVLNQPLDEVEFENLKNDLSRAKSMVFLCDNAGEIVLDKLFLEALKEVYPKLEICAFVRGADVQNDATMEDAVYVGLDKVVRVIPNGNRVPGTRISKLSPEAKELIENADVIISKGQGNFETLHGCGLNIYYLFLCKCEFFARKFELPLMSGVLCNENRIWK